MKKSGFYIIKEQFFEEMNEAYLKGNKKENRPHHTIIALRMRTQEFTG